MVIAFIFINNTFQYYSLISYRCGYVILSNFISILFFHNWVCINFFQLCQVVYCDNIFFLYIFFPRVISSFHFFPNFILLFIILPNFLLEYNFPHDEVHQVIYQFQLIFFSDFIFFSPSLPFPFFVPLFCRPVA